MAWFKKKADLLTDRANALNAEIAALESKIKRYESQVTIGESSPRMRSTALPPSSANVAPIFEKVDTNRLTALTESASTPEHFNDFGVRKYDLPALLRRWRDHFRGPSASNPKLVHYLAVGGLQGMRPLRREKRIARNRLVALVIMLLLLLLGLLYVFVPGR